MVKVLVIGGMYKGGGISEFIKNYYIKINQDSDIQIESMAESGSNEFREEMELAGIICHTLTPLNKNPFKYYREWKQFLNTHSYDYIHAHVDNLVRFAPYFIQRNSCNNFIIHSHNSFNDYVSRNPAKQIVNGLMKKMVQNRPFQKVACSKLASNWLFNNEDSKIIYNGINLAKFKFSENIRQEKRKQYGYSDLDKVIIHIGRFDTQKNHRQLIEIFKELKQNDEHYKLVLVGNGKLEDEVKRQIHNCGLVSDVQFLGYINNISDILSMGDMMIFPSLFEGFPISLVEAQATGLPIFYSNRITKEIEITESTKSINIDDSSNDIADYIHKNIKYNSKRQREESNDILRNKGFDIFDSIEQIKELYLGDILKSDTDRYSHTLGRWYR